MALRRKTNRDEPSAPTPQEKTLLLLALVGLVTLAVALLVAIWSFTQSVHVVSIVAVVMILCGGRVITAIAFGMDVYRRGRFIAGQAQRLQRPSLDSRLDALSSLEWLAIDNVKIITRVEKDGLTRRLAVRARAEIEERIIPTVVRATSDVNGIVRAEATRVIDCIKTAMNGR